MRPVCRVLRVLRVCPFCVLRRSELGHRGRVSGRCKGNAGGERAAQPPTRLLSSGEASLRVSFLCNGLYQLIYTDTRPSIHTVAVLPCFSFLLSFSCVYRLARPRARWYQLREFPLVGLECVCPQCNSSFVIARGSAMPSVMDLPVRISRSPELTRNANNDN